MKIIKNLLLSTTALLFISCGDNTTQNMTSDIKELVINENKITDIYSTDEMKLSATVIYENNTTADATNNVKWISSDYSIITQNYSKSIPILNGGTADISAVYNDFNSSIQLNIIGLKDINNSWSIVKTDINTTGDFTLTAEGNFSNGVNNKEIIHNISWFSSNSDDTIVVNDDYSVTLTIESNGDRNITARLFDNNETDKTISYSIN